MLISSVVYHAVKPQLIQSAETVVNSGRWLIRISLVVTFVLPDPISAKDNNSAVLWSNGNMFKLVCSAVSSFEFWGKLGLVCTVKRFIMKSSATLICHCSGYVI